MQTSKAETVGEADAGKHWIKEAGVWSRKSEAGDRWRQRQDRSKAVAPQNTEARHSPLGQAAAQACRQRNASCAANKQRRGG